METKSSITTASSPPFDDELVEKFLLLPESQTVECKRLGKLDRILDTIVAFANTEGGIIGLGFDDPEKAKGRARVYGLEENPSLLDELRRLVQSRITPEIEGIRFTVIGCTLRMGQQGTVCFLKIPKAHA